MFNSGLFRVLNLILGLTVLSVPCTGVRADTIELRADVWCPFNCEPNSDRPGFMVELAQEALAFYGHEVRYQTLTWGRSLEKTRNGEVNGVIGTDQDESPDLVFGSPMAGYQETLVFRKGEAREISTFEDLEGLRIGAIVDYEYQSMIKAYADEHERDPTRVQLIGGDSALKRNLQKLIAGRIDLTIDERSVLEYAVAQLGIADAVEILPNSDTTDLFIAFSPALESSEVYARQLAEGIERLKASGRYAEILARYGLSG